MKSSAQRLIPFLIALLFALTGAALAPGCGDDDDVDDDDMSEEPLSPPPGDDDDDDSPGLVPGTPVPGGGGGDPRGDDELPGPDCLAPCL